MEPAASAAQPTAPRLRANCTPAATDKTTPNRASVHTTGGTKFFSRAASMARATRDTQRSGSRLTGRSPNV